MKTSLLCMVLVALPAFASAAPAELEPDRTGVATLGPPGPHWFWANDLAFFNVADGRSYLLDADTGGFLGMLSTGLMWIQFALPGDYSAIYSPETYYTRGTRGERTDVVTFYDPNTLAPTGEVVIPPKRHSGVPNIGFSTITDDDAFVIVYNFSPAQSVSVVDVRKRTFAGEIVTAGCAMVYASGARSFVMMCGDGSLLTVRLDDAGREAGRERSKPFFDPLADPVMEKPVRSGDTWYFVSFAGVIHPVDIAGTNPTFSTPWQLGGGTEAGWRPGGIQILATHAGRKELYALMHEGGEDTHKWPGSEVWVHDPGDGKRARSIKLAHPAVGIVVTQDDQPLLLATHGEAPVVDVYDAASGRHLRAIDGLGQTPLLLQPVPVAR
jgi:methylamine dehydrogenase heavy chain